VDFECALDGVGVVPFELFVTKDSDISQFSYVRDRDNRVVSHAVDDNRLQLHGFKFSPVCGLDRRSERSLDG
jgi:hypothetical protein